jgi:hypothetical protein
MGIVDMISVSFHCRVGSGIQVSNFKFSETYGLDSGPNRRDLTRSRAWHSPDLKSDLELRESGVRLSTTVKKINLTNFC